MLRRLFDVSLATTALLLLSPVLLLAALGVRLSSPGAVLYRARRAGLGGIPFVMYKFRTMHDSRIQGSLITGHADDRVYPLGKLLRATKVDELPQLWNVLRGDMSIVGPRPEDPQIVAQHYDEMAMLSLNVRPGLASPGSIYGTTHMHLMGDDVDPQTAYLRDLLPIKLALEVVYVQNQSISGDCAVILRTIATILQMSAGRRTFPDPPELPAAQRLLQDFQEQQHNAAQTRHAA